VVVWDHESYNKISAAIYTPDGTPVNTNITAFTNNSLREATVMVQPDGGFVVTAVSGTQIRTQRFNHLGKPIGARQMVNTATTVLTVITAAMITPGTDQADTL
jgi:hypothetical protein